MRRFTIIEEETGLHLPTPFSMQAFLRHKNIVGAAVKNSLFYRKGDYFKWAFLIGEVNKVGTLVLKRILKDEKLANKISSKIRILSKKIFNFSLKIRAKDLGKENNDSLLKIYLGYGKILEELYVWGFLIETMETNGHLFSKLAEKELGKVIQRENLKRSIGEYFSILTIPDEESFAKKEEKDFFKLACLINKNLKIKKLFESKKVGEIIERLIDSPFGKKIKQHIEKYCWVCYNYEGPARDKESLVELLKHSIETIDPCQKIKELDEAKRESKKKKRLFMEELKPDKFLSRLIWLAREFVTLKMIRKEAIFHASFTIDKLRLEVASRLGISLNQARCMLPKEFIQALQLKRVNKAQLEAREKELVYLFDNGKEKIFIGEEAKKLSRLIIESKIKETTLLTGSCASPGKVSGKVKIIKNVNDMVKMKEGNILVAMATNPTFVPAMRKAAAIITDMGGLTCHAAIVSRELGIPCVVGTKIATKVLKDGDLVEMDANKGVVKILKKA